MKLINIDNENEGQKIDKFILKILKEMPKSFLYKMYRKKNIKLNDAKISGKETLKAGDEIKIFFSDETYEKFKGEEKENKVKKLFEVVYEDENVLIVNKPVGLLAHTSSGNYERNLVDSIKGYLGETSEGFKVSISNRLDRNTSGLVIAGKNLMAVKCINELIKEHKVDKYYKTIVKGELKGRKVLKGKMEKNEDKNKSKMSKEGKDVETIVKPIKSNGKFTEVEIKLITGRTHQIRVHLSSIGHPLLGDTKYGSRVLNEKLGLNMQLLHAYKLVFNSKGTMLEYLDGKEFICDKDFNIKL